MEWRAQLKQTKANELNKDGGVDSGRGVGCSSFASASTTQRALPTGVTKSFRQMDLEIKHFLFSSSNHKEHPACVVR